MLQQLNLSAARKEIVRVQFCHAILLWILSIPGVYVFGEIHKPLVKFTPKFTVPEAST